MSFINDVTLKDEPLALGDITALDTATIITAGQDNCQIYSGTPTPNSFVGGNFNGAGTARIQIKGTWTGSIQLEFSTDGGQTFMIASWQVNGTIYTRGTVTANGTFMGVASGCTNFRARAVAGFTGTATVIGVLSPTTGDVKINNALRLVDNNTGSMLTITNGAALISGNVEISNDTGSPIPVSGTVAISNPVTTVSVSNLPTTQPVSGTVAVSNFPASVEVSNDSGNPLPVSGSISVSNLPVTQPVSGSVSVSNLPATQPISAAALPLPSGAATSTKQDTGNTSLASIDTKTPALGQAAMASSTPVVIASNQSAIPVSGTFYQSTQPISASSLPLPTGASTSALQTTGNTSLASIDTKLTAPLSINPTRPSTGTYTTFASLVTAAKCLSANANRKGVIIQALNSVSIGLSSTVSATTYTYKIVANGVLEITNGYTGDIWAIGASTLTITELT